MADLWTSLALLIAIVLFSEATRRTVARLFPGDYWIYLVEAVSTFQLCACTHELKLLAGVGRIDLHTCLTLTYIMTIVHISTFQGASCNPNGALERFYRGSITAKAAVGIIACQILAAVAAQLWVPSIWALGLSDLHVRHGRFEFRCFDPINGTLAEAAAVELACAFTVQAAVMHIHKLHPRLRLHAIAAVIAFLVYSGGSISGAVFNPALAFSIQFPCSGHSYLEYSFVYWLGPLFGMTSCILLFEKVIPFLSGKSTIGLDVYVGQTKKVQ